MNYFCFPCVLDWNNKIINQSYPYHVPSLAAWDVVRIGNVVSRNNITNLSNLCGEKVVFGTFEQVCFTNLLLI